MRELFVVTEESTDSSLVLHTDEGEEFFIDLTKAPEDVRSKLDASETAPALAPAPAPQEAPARPTTDALSMRPPEIQNRIRAGATVTELAEEMGVAESRVEPFAHPVLLERARIAELAKQAHPQREDGPAKLTIFEILATAFAARGHSLADAEWDAYRIKGEPWIIRVSWKAGLSENEAEWILKQSTTSPDVLEARNTVAADLTDPDFVQPVRTLTSVSHGEHGQKGGSRRLQAMDTNVEEDSHDGDHSAEVSSLGDHPKRNAPGSDEPAVTADDGQPEEEAEFLQHPDPEPAPTKRRRKAVTPRWEDVLLGVRTNTKRPRS